MADLMKQAEGKLQGGFLAKLFGGPRYDEAQDCFQQAANQFKLAKDWDQAAQAFERCAYCANKSSSQNDEANFYTEAGNVLKKVSTQRACEQFEKAIVLQGNGGKFQQAGKLLMTIAELLEAGSLETKQVKDYYKRAAEMFELDEHGKSNLTKCNLKVAEFAAKDGELQEAIRIFESEGEKALQNNLLQFNAKDRFLNAGILHLVEGDSVSVNIAVDKYRSLDPRFASSREGELLGNLAAAFEGGDVELFTDKLFEYDQVTKLDAWRTDLLVKVKDSMSGGGLDALGGGAVDLT
jgi:alpha-soluble NSF attachment protein